MSYLRIALLFLCVTSINVVNASALPSGFVYLNDVAPTIVLDMRYTTSENFIGTPIDGYIKPVAIATKEATIELNNVQIDLQRFGLSLKIYDAYRPQRAIDHFVRWAKDLTDVRKQIEYYPKVAKQVLFQEGYIASKSWHSRGSTFDLTLVSIDNKGAPRELDMGTPFDFFDPKSGSEYEGLTVTQRANRLLLKTVMVKQGFKPYPKEWWHFTLKGEPYPDTYFNFVIE
jgi:D-alanyl-D-alanine dipeptidase